MRRATAAVRTARHSAIREGGIRRCAALCRCPAIFRVPARAGAPSALAHRTTVALGSLRLLYLLWCDALPAVHRRSCLRRAASIYLRLVSARGCAWLAVAKAAPVCQSSSAAAVATFWRPAHAVDGRVEAEAWRRTTDHGRVEADGGRVEADARRRTTDDGRAEADAWRRTAKLRPWRQAPKGWPRTPRRPRPASGSRLQGPSRTRLDWDATTDSHGAAAARPTRRRTSGTDN